MYIHTHIHTYIHIYKLSAPHCDASDPTKFLEPSRGRQLAQRGRGRGQLGGGGGADGEHDRIGQDGLLPVKGYMVKFTNYIVCNIQTYIYTHANV